MNRSRFLTIFWIAAIGALYAVHLFHLSADFPNFSPWMDYSKYTDEGWYGSAAVRYALTGSWRVPGDFNPAAAVPVWPVFEGVLFHFTGVSIVAARALALAVFAGNLMLACALFLTQKQRPSAALLAMTLLAGNAFLYSFSRLALLEPMLIFWTLFSWLLVLRVPNQTREGARYLLLAFAGASLCLAILTKTTGVFLLPAAFYLVWYVAGFRLGVFARYAAVTGGTLALLWSAYYFLLVHPRYLKDYSYLFAVNQMPQPVSVGGWLAAFWYAAHGALWIDKPLATLAAVLLVISLFYRELWRGPIFAASWIAIAGYVFFIGYHNNMQPRYYQVIAFPLVFVMCAGLAALWQRWPWAAAAGLAVLLVSLGLNLRMVGGFARHPEYTFVTAARNLTRYIDEHPNGNRLLLSISGADITLITHLPSICDDFGTYDLPYRIHTYRPGWYAAWNDLDPGTLADINTQYALKEAAHFHAFDDPDRNDLVLYRMEPLPSDKQSYNAEEEQAENAGR
ncbi:MAG: phospholipid carrier-dependent glycosyltransferase [Acidobacterium ailaaui]|nr:phospholipid carrier-dependent glycosyltransferase [Pseudacidobacterium ailaaui]